MFQKNGTEVRPDLARGCPPKTGVGSFFGERFLAK